MESPLKIYRASRLKDPSLILAWSQDAGKLGPRVVDFLRRKLGGEVLGEIEPQGFFPMAGVAIEDDVTQFPQSRFYSCEVHNLLLFVSDAPHREHYRFLSSVLDFAVNYCHGQAIYSLGGIVSPIPHTAPRGITAVVNRKEVKETLAGLGLEVNLNFQTPPGVRPTLNSFLLWMAKQKDISGANLWGIVPFYLAPSEDPRAWKEVLSALDRIFGLGMAFEELDLEIQKQDEVLTELAAQNPDVGKSLEMLERGIMPDEREREQLTSAVTEFFAKRG